MNANTANNINTVSTVAKNSVVPAQAGLVAKMADKYGVERESFSRALTRVAFPSEQKIEPAEMLALLVVADQYDLNPFLKQIYAFKNKSGAIVPLVSIDGWMSILARNPDYKGMKIEMAEKKIKICDVEIPEWCDCTMYNRKLETPITIREYADEAFVKTSPVWKSYPKRMLRNRSIVQCARIAFALGGISFVDNEADPWEAMRNPASAESALQEPKPASAVSPKLIDGLIDQGTKSGNWKRVDEFIAQRFSPEDQIKVREYIHSRLAGRPGSFGADNSGASGAPGVQKKEPIEDIEPVPAQQGTIDESIGMPVDDAYMASLAAEMQSGSMI